MPPTLSEDEINALVESFTDDNFFEKCLALNPEDPDHVNGIKAAQLAFNSEQRSGRSYLYVSASNGWLVWHCDGFNGRGSTNASGTGNFFGNEIIPGHVLSGTFFLTITANSASLFLSGGFNWRGTGTGHHSLQGANVSGGYN